MLRLRNLIILLLAASAGATCTTGASGTCEVGAGKTYATIQACATAMANGQTCTVFAGTYPESVTVTAGGVGSYKTIQVNGSDIVRVNSFTLNSHTKLVGNCTAPASTGGCGFSLGTTTTTALTASCVSVSDSATDVYIKNNVMYGCGNTTIVILGGGTNGVSFVYVQGNTMSYGCGTTTTPNNCSAVAFNGNHVLVENNDMSHLGLAIQTFAQSTVIRNNRIHDMYETECGPASGNCHLDIIYAERSNAVASYLVQNQLWEGNTSDTVLGADGKGLWTAADMTALGNGCSNATTFLCFNVIGRYNIMAHFGSGVLSHTSGFQHVKYYNNDVIDAGLSAHGINATLGNYMDGLSAYGGLVNTLFYFPFSIATQTWGWDAYSLQTTNNLTGYRSAANLAYCTSTPCALQVERAGSSPFLFAADPNSSPANILASSDPLTNYAGGDYHLSTTSQAKNAGTFLTTASGSGSNSTSLIVGDAAFFQDGLGLASVGVQADCISITTVTNHVCITTINYSTNTLTLASAISWTNGDPVWLYSKSDGVRVLTGTAPDIGALPFQAAASTFSISGSISPGAGSSNPNPGVTISCPACSPTSTTTAADGTYSFLNQASGGTYVLTPSASTYSFSPSNSTFTNLSANQTANFTATGTPTAGVSPTVLSFGSQGIGTTSAGQITRLANNGTGQLTGISVSITGTNAGDFAQTNTCATTLNAGLQCAVTVTFTPTTSGTRSATVSFTDSLGTQTASLSGTGYLAPVPSCQPSGGSWKSGRLVTCTNQVPAATMCWQIGTPPTTDGNGTCTSGNTYTGAFMVTQTGTLFVTGTQSGNIDSTVSYTHILPNGPWTTGWVMNLPGGGNTRFGRIFGPPLFSGSTSSTAVAVTPPLPNLASVNATGYAYSNPGDFYYPASGKGNCITALTDSTTKPGFGFHSSWSGGGGNVMYDVDRAFGSMTDNNNMLYFHVHYDANGCMQRDSDVATTSLSGGAGAGGLSFSRVTPGRVYRVDGGGHNPNGTDLYQEDLTYNSGTPFGTISVARTLLFHWNNCPGVPGGTTVSQGGNGNLNVSYDDNIFSTSLNIKVSTGVPPSGQDNGHWVLAWNKSTGQCTTYYTGTLQNAENPQNGNIWTWCGPGDCSQAGSNPPPDFLNNTCLSLSAGAGYGIHDTAAAFQGQYIEISGKCDPNASSNNQSWKYGTNLLQNCSSATFNCGGHAPMGYSTTRQVNNGMTIRNVSDLSTWTTFRASVPPVDFHGGTNWFGATSDVNPWMASTQSSAVGGDCTGLYLCNEVVGFRLDGTIVRFAPNYYSWPAGSLGHGLGPIPAMTQDGYCVVFESTWNGTRGSLANGDLRTDLFSICNLQ